MAAWLVARGNKFYLWEVITIAKIYYEQDCNLQALSGKKVAIIGYGSQGHAHVLNLYESDVDVIVGLYQGSKSWAKAEEAGLTVVTVEEAAQELE